MGRGEEGAVAGLRAEGGEQRGLGGAGLRVGSKGGWEGGSAEGGEQRGKQRGGEALRRW